MLADEGQHDAAIAQFKEVIRLEPDDARPHNNLGSALEAEGQHDAAIAEFKEAIPTRINEGQHDAAIAEFKEAIRLKPDLA